jgi:hypothetical protein
MILIDNIFVIKVELIYFIIIGTGKYDVIIRKVKLTNIIINSRKIKFNYLIRKIAITTMIVRKIKSNTLIRKIKIVENNN